MLKADRHRSVHRIHGGRSVRRAAAHRAVDGLFRRSATVRHLVRVHRAVAAVLILLGHRRRHACVHDGRVTSVPRLRVHVRPVADGRVSRSYPDKRGAILAETGINGECPRL